jgi:hypothetical protein
VLFNETLSHKNSKENLKSWGVVQVVEHLSSKCDTLGSNQVLEGKKGLFIESLFYNELLKHIFQVKL